MNIEQIELTSVIHVNKIRITIRAKYQQWKECFFTKKGVLTGKEYYINDNGINFLIDSIQKIKREC